MGRNCCFPRDGSFSFGFIILLSNAVDREVAQLNTSSELREQADLVLISLIDMAVADRSYAKKPKARR